ncbi:MULTISPECIES: glycoside hydrolase family 3 C-terminal domain-containing protein [unclassified Clostridium]|uniref:glycoside hydrolase family 3 protein n=1 Tax=unclassified Clostridium TaxID=2614128 RepID=UPI001FAAF206|nr:MULTISPECIES: glycoside hydrolase family 3 C-terminal domain-containing protein [unclassified Clostridium]
MKNQVVLDWNQYVALARQTVAEGCVLLENKDQALPLVKDEKVAVFGRIQNHYYKSGTGSGGMVNVSKVYGIVDGLRESGQVILDEELIKIYQDWEETHPFNEGEGWGNEPWCQEEMELTDEVVEAAGKRSETAIVIIGRTAGEDKDASDTKGSYQLTDVEEDLLTKVRKNFDKMIVLLNVGGLLDMSFTDRYQPEAVMYVWQGGMVGGLGTADVLTGAVSPSGHLTDTIAYKVADYPSTPYFGDPDKNYYSEDIYVGYRYFETFAKDSVRYPFGYGLSYTTFEKSVVVFANEPEKQQFTLHVTVSNVGLKKGKDVVQIYAELRRVSLEKQIRFLSDLQRQRSLHRVNPKK